MISRIADHCFWFGRYVERTEATARMLSASMSLALDAEIPAQQIWRSVLVVSGEEDEFRVRCAEGDDDHGAWADGEVVQRFMVWDEQNGVSLHQSVSGARANARSIREVLSLEAWEAVNELYLWMTSEVVMTSYAQHRDAFYARVRRSTQLGLGLLRSTMLHDEPLDFMWLGVLLERVNQTARMLDVHHHVFRNLPRSSDADDVVETGLWLSLLRALSGSEAFLKRSGGRLSSDAVARFLISEPAFPRSIVYCVKSAYERLCSIRPPENHTLPGGAALEQLRILDAWVGDREDETLSGAGVHDLLTYIVDEVHEICGTLGTELLGAGRAS